VETRKELRKSAFDVRDDGMVMVAVRDEGGDLYS
jgi:hypothetical protein